MILYNFILPGSGRRLYNRSYVRWGDGRSIFLNNPLVVVKNLKFIFFGGKIQFTGIGFFPVPVSTIRNMCITFSKIGTLAAIRQCFDDHNSTWLDPTWVLAI